jgi:hypothetical protein
MATPPPFFRRMVRSLPVGQAMGSGANCGGPSANPVVRHWPTDTYQPRGCSKRQAVVCSVQNPDPVHQGNCVLPIESRLIGSPCLRRVCSTSRHPANTAWPSATAPACSPARSCISRQAAYAKAHSWWTCVPEPALGATVGALAGVTEPLSQGAHAASSRVGPPVVEGWWLLPLRFFTAQECPGCTCSWHRRASWTF